MLLQNLDQIGDAANKFTVYAAQRFARNVENPS